MPLRETADKIRKSHYIFAGEKVGDIRKTLMELFDHRNPGEGSKPAVYFFENKKLVWFPQIAVEKDGTLKPPTGHNWRNTVSSDFSELLQKPVNENVPNESADERGLDLSFERAIFALLPGEEKAVYTFLGVFQKKHTTDIYGAEVYHRICDNLCFDDWIPERKAE
jgi:hypothetical protein